MKWQWPTVGDRRRKIKRKHQAFRFRDAIWKPDKWVSLNNEAWGGELLTNLKYTKSTYMKSQIAMTPYA
jgi:hypothetical protein